MSECLLDVSRRVRRACDRVLREGPCETGALLAAAGSCLGQDIDAVLEELCKARAVLVWADGGDELLNKP